MVKLIILFIILNHDATNFFAKLKNYLMLFQNLICSRMIFSVYMESDYTFMSIFLYLEFKKLIIGDRRHNTCNTVSFGGI